MPKQNACSIMGQVSKFFHVFLTERCVLIHNLRLARAESLPGNQQAPEATPGIIFWDEPGHKFPSDGQC
jgi:hypothetical protein